jgi:hypothetical protein
VEIINWVFVVMALSGAVCAAAGSPVLVFLAQVLWVISNVGLAAHNYKQKDIPQAALFSAYTIICFWGVYRWLPEVLK